MGVTEPRYHSLVERVSRKRPYRKLGSHVTIHLVTFKNVLLDLLSGIT